MGVDGGGTGTKVAVVCADGRQVASAESGSTNQNSVGAEAARANLASALREAVAEAGGTVRGVALTMSGVDRPGDAERVREWVAAAGCVPEAAGVAVENDAVGALAAGTVAEGAPLAGVVCISGTGHIAFGRTEAGESVRCAGHGCLTDRGSGYDIGLEALRAVYGAADGSAPATGLEAVVRAHCGVDKTEDLIGWTYSDLSFSRVASIAVRVFEEDARGDAVAAAILDRAAEALAVSVSTVVGKLGGPGGVVVAAGSVCQNPAMVRRLGALLPGHRVSVPARSASFGAARLALQRFGGSR